MATMEALIELVKALIGLGVSLGGDVATIIKNANVDEETQQSLLKRVEEAHGEVRQPDEGVLEAGTTEENVAADVRVSMASAETAMKEMDTKE